MSRERPRPWKRPPGESTQVGVPRAPRGPHDDEEDDEVRPIGGDGDGDGGDGDGGDGDLDAGHTVANLAIGDETALEVPAVEVEPAVMSVGDETKKLRVPRALRESSRPTREAPSAEPTRIDIQAAERAKGPEASRTGMRAAQDPQSVEPTRIDMQAAERAKSAEPARKDARSARVLPRVPKEIPPVVPPVAHDAPVSRDARQVGRDVPVARDARQIARDVPVARDARQVGRDAGGAGSAARTSGLAGPAGPEVGGKTELVPGLQLKAKADPSAYLARIRAAPADPDARHALRAFAGDAEVRERLAAMLAEAARSEPRADVRAAFLEELAEALEDLERPAEALAALEELVRLAPGELSHHDRLAQLYLAQGAPLKSAAALEQVAALSRDARARAALVAAARLYREHGRPERAVEILKRLTGGSRSAETPIPAAALANGRAPEPASSAGPERDRVSDRAPERDRASDRAPERDRAPAPTDRDRGAARERAERERAERERTERERAERERAEQERAERAAALVEAARRLRDTGDLAGAARAFDEASDLSPDDVGLELERDAARAAAVIARAAGEARGGDVLGAEHRLRGMLAARPYDAEASLALAQLLGEAGRTEEAAEHLYQLLEAQPDPFAREVRARLVHRYAQLVAALGAADEAHQLIQDAHRLDRRNLLITLALGESCFARRLWRESAIHLGGLAEHPDAPRHGPAVAAGLVRAAQADVRALRPGNAEGRLAAAVKLDPGCAPAWRGLAELALERGDLRTAAGHLEREAAATADPHERARKYDAAGDLARDKLGDLALAERCWMAVVDVAPAATLEKLLALQRRRGAGLARARVCERLAELAGEAAGELTGSGASADSRARAARARKDLLEEATDAYAADGDLESASSLAMRLVTAHPLDVDAVACASGVALAAGDHASAAAWLGRALTAWDDGPDSEDPRRAELWRRLGDARRARGDGAGAHIAYERAVAEAPDSDGAQAARRGLVALAAVSGRSAADSLAGLVAAEQEPGDVLAWARACAGGAGGGAEDARPLYDLARALGAQLSGEDERFLASHPLRALAPDQAYAAPLDDAERRALVDDEADAPLADLLAQLGEVAALLCPAPPAALVDAGLLDAERLPAASPLAAAAAYPQIAKALGGPATLLHTTSAPAAPEVALLLAAPPVVMLGPRLAGRRGPPAPPPALAPPPELEPVPDGELRFRLGRAVELARFHRCLAAGVRPERFARFVEGLRRAVQEPPESDAHDPALARETKRLRSAIPLLLRRRLGERLAGAAPDPAAYLAACERAADRSGLLACGDVATALRLAGGARAPRHLVRLAASPRFLAARRKLWSVRR